ncbi:hypothetical protein ABEB36_004617 [Hypothenemus hampei]|uniref:MADF domain-containing protein n=1 Tax=Hypothenemus hampei TaxID=57062 RepID=A0ABD1F702_HYPHA
MEWSEELTMKLIEVYRKYELLWNPKHPHYYNKNKKFDAWSDLAAQLERPIDACKTKISALLSSLRRERADEVYISSWYAFKSLQFLLDRDKPRERVDTITCVADKPSEISAVATNDITETPASQIIDASNENPAVPKLSSASLKASQKRKKRDTEQERLDKAFDILTSTAAANCPSETSNDAFGKYIAKKMDKYTSNTQIAVEQAIMNVLFNADRGLYEPNFANSHFTSIYPSHQNQQLQCNAFPIHSQYTQRVQSQTQSSYPSPTQTSSSVVATPSPSPSLLNTSSLATAYEDQLDNLDIPELTDL